MNSSVLTVMETTLFTSCLLNFLTALPQPVDATQLTLSSHIQLLILFLIRNLISVLLAQHDSPTVQHVLTMDLNARNAKTDFLKMRMVIVLLILVENKMSMVDVLHATLKETQVLFIRLKTILVYQNVEIFMFKLKKTDVSSIVLTAGSRTFMNAENVMFRTVNTVLMMENALSALIMQSVS